MEDKKGFMLAEIIIVSTIVMIGLVSLFTLANKMFIKYDKRIVYDTVDATYVSRGLAENYTKDMIEIGFDEDTDYLLYESNNEYLKRNNVVKSYIVRYNKESIENLLKEELNKEEEKRIETNFYSYIEKYKNSNNFSDEYDINENRENTYNYIIFTEISDKCEEIETVEGDKIKKCTEQNGNLSFGYYKFGYIIRTNELESKEDDEIKDVSDDIKPPIIKEVSFIEDTRLKPVLCSDGQSNCVETLHDIVGQVNINWKIKDEFNTEIKQVGFMLYNENNELVFEKTIDKVDEDINDGTFSLNMLKDFENELSRGKYYIKVYAVDSKDNSGKELCDISYSSSYCKRSDILDVKYKLYFDSKPDQYGIVTINNQNSIYYGGMVDFTVDKKTNVLGKTVTFENFYVTYENGTSPELPSNIDTKVPGTYSVTVYEDGYIGTYTTAKTSTSSEGDSGCLAEGTKILLANGKYKNIEDITYNDLLTVIDYQNGGVTYQYPNWLEKRLLSNNYIKITFSDDTIINIVKDHAFFSYDDNEFVTVSDKNKFHIGTKVAKLKNNKLEKVYVKNIEYINEEIYYHHVISSRYYNVIAEGIVTTDDVVFVTNLYSFNNNITWKNSPITDVYTNEEISVAPSYIFRGLRMYDGKIFTNIGMGKEKFISFLLDNQLNEEIWEKPKLNKNGKREWMVTTSDDIVTEKNKLSYLIEEGDYYTLKEPIKKENKKFLGWYHTGEATYHQPGDKVEVLYGTHFVAKWDNSFDRYNGSDNFEKIRQ